MIDPEQFSCWNTRWRKNPIRRYPSSSRGWRFTCRWPGLVDTSEERARLEKELAETAAQIERLETLLSGSFAEKAPAAVVEKERQKLATYKETTLRLQSQLDALN